MALSPDDYSNIAMVTEDRPMRGRDVREMLQGKVEPIVANVLAAFAETQYAMLKEHAAVVGMCNQLVDTVAALTEFGGTMRQKMEEFQKNTHGNSDVENSDGA